MKSLFKEINRKNTDCCKWDLSEKVKGINKEELNSFWIADSDYETCPKVKKDLIKRAKHGVYGYSFTSDEYFEVLTKWVSSHYGYEVNKDNTVLTVGVVNALNFIVKAFTSQGDNIVVNPPVYNPFYDVIKNNGRNVITSTLIKTDIDKTLFTYNIDFNDLEEKIKNAKMYILCNPHNPVGRCYTKDEIEKIVGICKKYDCILVSDEIHCDLIMPGYSHTSVGKYFDKYNKMIICTAPSKTFNIAGLGNSNIFFNDKEMFDLFSKSYEEMSIIHNMFGIVATTSAYKYGSSWVVKQNEHLDKQRELVYEFAKSNNIKVCKLEGTYLMWLDLSRLGLSQEELIDGLTKKNVWVNSGTLYDNSAIGFIRINIACSKKQLANGLKLIGEFINSNNK